MNRLNSKATNDVGEVNLINDEMKLPIYLEASNYGLGC